MSDTQQAAKELAQQLYEVDRERLPNTGRSNEWDVEWVKLIALALTQAEQRGMARAAWDRGWIITRRDDE